MEALYVPLTVAFEQTSAFTVVLETSDPSFVR